MRFLPERFPPRRLRIPGRKRLQDSLPQSQQASRQGRREAKSNGVELRFQALVTIFGGHVSIPIDDTLFTLSG
jgi:hypothetical protein